MPGKRVTILQYSFKHGTTLGKTQLVQLSPTTHCVPSTCARVGSPKEVISRKDPVLICLYLPKLESKRHKLPVHLGLLRNTVVPTTLRMFVVNSPC